MKVTSTLEFKVLTEAGKSRVGEIKTRSGVLDTPAYVFPATYASVVTQSSQDIKKLEVQALIANTFHLWVNNVDEEIGRSGGLNKYMHFEGVTMTDSGGFQVFSYGMAREHASGKIAFPDVQKVSRNPKNRLARVQENGVSFSLEGKQVLLTPEKSIEIQERLGADIMFAFDECHSIESRNKEEQYKYAAESLQRSHRWEKDSLETKSTKQALYGIVHGANFKDLREQSARYISSLPFDGFAIGGFLGESKSEMHQVLDWTISSLGAEKPLHLLGIGHVDDIFEAVERGVDTFDCVEVTRLARHEWVFVSPAERGNHHRRKEILVLGYEQQKENLNPIDNACTCHTCKKYSRADLVRLKWSGDEGKKREYRFALTQHNLFFMNNLMRLIRDAIRENRFEELKKEWVPR